MNINPASITLTPLSEDELQLCLLLLETPLHNRQKMSALIREIESYLFKAIPNRWRKERRRSEYFGNRLLLLYLARVDRGKKWVRGEEEKKWMKNMRDDLCNIQSTWRSRANGPRMVNPDVEGYKEDFDSHILKSHTVKLPPLGFIEQLGSRRMRQPLLAIILNDVDDTFEVLLARAISNKQVSRLARCTVCGRWELKARAGRRSQVKVEFCKKHPISNFSKWPEFIRRVPHWPALCNRKPCRDRFANVAGERSQFKEADFPGIQGKGMTQILPRNFTYKTEIFPE